MNEDVKKLHAYMDEIREEILDCAGRIFCYAEASGQEVRSAEALEQLLEDRGFRVERGLKGLPTAFRAVYGSGPVRIGLMCEYDALAGLHQEPVPWQKGNGGFGHGCGHHLLGTGSAAAGILLKAFVEEGLPATIVVYGTPAEETLEGKTILIQNGYFRDVDVVLGWHPHNHNNPGRIRHKAAGAFTMTFRGRAAHACNCPENGRSALDAAELTNIGCNYLREHMDRDSYLHYCYIHGGERPNIVPDYAKLWYMVRAATYSRMKELEERVKRTAQGACMMTDTTVEFETLGDTHDNRVNLTLARLAQDCMGKLGMPSCTEEEQDFASRLAAGIGVEGCTGEYDRSIPGADQPVEKDNGSTDFSDVSQVVPANNLFVACFLKQTPLHSWAATAQGTGSYAYKGMVLAAEILALMGVEIVRDKGLLERIQKEFQEVHEA